VVREALTASGDIQPRGGQLLIGLDPLSAPHRTQAIAAFATSSTGPSPRISTATIHAKNGEGGYHAPDEAFKCSISAIKRPYHQTGGDCSPSGNRKVFVCNQLAPVVRWHRPVGVLAPERRTGGQVAQASVALGKSVSTSRPSPPAFPGYGATR
jgi:hypothetical protein